EVDALRRVPLARRLEPGRAPADGAAVLAGHLGGHALADLAVGAGVAEQAQVGVRVDVDEAGAERESVQVDFAIAARLNACCDLDDPPAAHRDIAADRCAAGSVVDKRAAQNEVGAGTGIAAARGGEWRPLFRKRIRAYRREGDPRRDSGAE